ncbi:FAD/NAD(P)-binding protein [Nocardiopsis sediminis]|uniref:FAD/NAD(P)-binding protein n=1 Tax=Nocardiopsis sediminis TaxID=1778267 RepID=A0ABV8FMG0_9ACTN
MGQGADPAGRPPPTIVCAGGGPSAAVAAIALLRATTWLRLGYRIVLVDEHGHHARGPGYAPGDARLLETPVKAGSVLPDQPCHLMDWARGAGLACGPETRLPRGVYGDYLAGTLAATAQWAAPHAGVRMLTGRVVRVAAASADVVVDLAGGGRIDAVAAIVATGDPRVAPPPAIPGFPEAGTDGITTCSRGALLTPGGGVARRVFAVGPVRRGHAGTTIDLIGAQCERLAERIADTVLRDRAVVLEGP